MKNEKGISIRYDKDLNFVDINSDDFCVTYGNGVDGHGLQCQYPGGTKEYDEIKSIMNNIACNVKHLARYSKINSNGTSNKRTLLCPAIYRYFKNKLYVTMGVSKSIDKKSAIYKYIMDGKSNILASLTRYHGKNKIIPVYKVEGNWYHVLEESEGELVIYKDLYECSSIPYIQPINLFLSEIDRNKYPRIKQEYRFELFRGNFA